MRGAGRWPRGVPRSRAGLNNTPSAAFTATPLSIATTNAAPTTPVVTSIAASSSGIVSGSTTTIMNVTDGGDTPRDLRDLLMNLDIRVRSLETKTIKLTSVVKELNDTIKKYCKASFTIRGTPLEVTINRTNYYSMINYTCFKSEIAKLFCLSLKRQPTSAEIQVQCRLQ